MMEVVDNAIVVRDPGRDGRGARARCSSGARWRWRSVIAGCLRLPGEIRPVASPAARATPLSTNTGIHGGPPVKLVGAIAVVAAVFGTAVLINDAVSGDDDDHEPIPIQRHEPTEHGTKDRGAG